MIDFQLCAWCHIIMTVLTFGICITGHDSRVDGLFKRGQTDDPRIRVQATQRPRIRDQLLPEDVGGRPAGNGTQDARQPPQHVHHDQGNGRMGSR